MNSRKDYRKRILNRTKLCTIIDDVGNDDIQLDQSFNSINHKIRRVFATTGSNIQAEPTRISKQSVHDRLISIREVKA